MRVWGIDLSKFPKRMELKYGREGEREWYEWYDRRRAVVIQRFGSEPFSIFFIDGSVIRVLEIEDMKVFMAESIEEAKKALEDLGFAVEVNENYEDKV